MNAHGIWLQQPEHDLFLGLLALRPREREIAFLLAAGYSRTEIAIRRYVEMTTVRTHQRTIWRACGLPRGTPRLVFMLRMQRLKRALADWEAELADERRAA